MAVLPLGDRRDQLEAGSDLASIACSGPRPRAASMLARRLQFYMRRIAISAAMPGTETGRRTMPWHGSYRGESAEGNRNCQRELARNLVESLGIEEAFAVARDNLWLGVLDHIRLSEPISVSQGPTARVAGTSTMWR